MAEAIWLHCRLARSERIDVYVAVASQDVVFASDDSGAPDGIRVCLCPDEEGRPALAPPARVLPSGALSFGRSWHLYNCSASVSASSAQPWLPTSSRHELQPTTASRILSRSRAKS